MSRYSAAGCFFDLYNLLCIVHPNLIEDHKKPTTPQLTEEMDIYPFVDDYHRQVLSRTYTDKENVE